VSVVEKNKKINYGQNAFKTPNQGVKMCTELDIKKLKMHLMRLNYSENFIENGDKIMKSFIEMEDEA
jgi:hypothetical protein